MKKYKIKICQHILYSLRFALPLNKVGGTSKIKICQHILYSLRFALPLPHKSIFLRRNEKKPFDPVIRDCHMQL